MKKLLAVTAILAFATSANAGVIRITEWMYNPNSVTPGLYEFVEICNIDASSQDMTGWSFDDNSRAPGSFSLNGLGTLAAGQCGIITEAPTAGDFETEWAIGSGSVPIAAGNANNLGRNDEINIYDAGNALVDRLTFGDQDFPGTLRTQGKSGWVSQAGLGANTLSAWTLSAVADAQGSVTSAHGDIGSPGRHIVPEPTAFSMMVLVLAAISGSRRGLKGRRGTRVESN